MEAQVWQVTQTLNMPRVQYKRMPGRFYDEHEAEEILRLAVSDSVTTGAMTRERLLATASELGISEDAVARAEQQLALQKDEVARKEAEARELAAYKADRRRAQLSEVGNWAGTSIILVGIDLITSHHITWSVWPVGMWGLVVFGTLIEQAFSPAKQDRHFERWKRKQERRAEKAALRQRG